MAAKMVKSSAADEHVVEMRDDEVRVAELPVERRDRQHDAGEPGDQELEEEARGRTASAS